MSMRVGLNRTTSALVICCVLGTALSAHSASAPVPGSRSSPDCGRRGNAAQSRLC